MEEKHILEKESCLIHIQEPRALHRKEKEKEKSIHNRELMLRYREEENCIDMLKIEGHLLHKGKEQGERESYWV